MASGMDELQPKPQQSDPWTAAHFMLNALAPDYYKPYTPPDIDYANAQPGKIGPGEISALPGVMTDAATLPLGLGVKAAGTLAGKAGIPALGMLRALMQEAKPASSLSKLITQPGIVDPANFSSLHLPNGAMVGNVAKVPGGAFDVLFKHWPSKTESPKFDTINEATLWAQQHWDEWLNSPLGKATHGDDASLKQYAPMGATALNPVIPSPVPEELAAEWKRISPYTTPAYRGIGQPPRQTYAGSEYGPMYSSATPELANKYATDYASGTYTGNRRPAVMPLMLDTSNYLTHDAQGGSWAQHNAPALTRASKEGKSGVIMRNVHDEPDSTVTMPPQTVYITTDPGTRRSKFAQFNPKMWGVDDLLAGLAGGAVVTPAVNDYVNALKGQ